MNRAKSHATRLTPGHGIVADVSQRSDSRRPGSVRGHQDERTRAVCDGATVARGDRARRWFKHWLQSGECFDCLALAWSRVLLNHRSIGQSNRSRFALVKAAIPGCDRTLMAEQCETILFLARNIEVLRQQFCGLPHVQTACGVRQPQLQSRNRTQH